MKDLYLEALTKGEIFKSSEIIAASQTTEKNRFKIALDNNVQEILDFLLSEEILFDQVQLVSPKMKRKKEEKAIKDIFENYILSSLIDRAMPTLMHEGAQYLDAGNFAALLKDFEETLENLNQVDLGSSVEQLNTIVNIKEETLATIFQIAIAKFQKQDLSKSLALFVLLTLLKPEEFDYRYRTGIVAQQCQNYNLAIEAYGLAAFLNLEHIETYLFAAEFHLKLDQQFEAKFQYEKAKKNCRSHSFRKKLGISNR